MVTDDSVFNHYRESLAEYGESPKALHWTRYRSAAIRYRELVRSVDLNGKSVLDAGCGMGDLLPYVYAESDDFRYLGVDINAAFVEIAEKRYAGHDFRVADLFDGSLPAGSFDVVLSSGVMNTNEPGWLEKRKHMITTLFGIARETLVFNMAGSHEPPKATAGSRVAYAPADEIAEFCRTLSSKVTVRTDYHPKDFTVTMLH